MIVVEHMLRAVINTIPEIRLNENLSSKPKFHWGDEKELNRYIQLKKDESYPLIWLLPSTDKYEGSLGQEVIKECIFIIATRETRKELFNDQRYINSFDVVLQPLTEKLIHGITVSSITDRIDDDLEIMKFPNYSNGSEKNGTIDLWDAIQLTINVRFSSSIKCLKPIFYDGILSVDEEGEDSTPSTPITGGGSSSPNLKPSIRPYEIVGIQTGVLSNYVLNISNYPETVVASNLPNGLEVNNQGVIFGIATGEDRDVISTIEATNSNGQDIEDITFKLTSEEPYEDPTRVEGGGFVNRTYEENSDTSSGKIQEESRDGIPYISFDPNKIYYVRIGVPYYMQIGGSSNGGPDSGRLYTNVDSVFSDVIYYYEVARLTGVPTGLPRKETLTFSITNSANGKVGVQEIEFELIEDIGIETMLKPYGMISKDITKNSFNISWYNREHKYDIVATELWRDNELFQTYQAIPKIEGNLADNRRAAIFKQFTSPENEVGFHTYKIREKNSLGEFSPFSDEVSIQLEGRGIAPIINKPGTLFLRIGEFFEYEFTADIPVDYWTMFNLPKNIDLVNYTESGLVEGFVFDQFFEVGDVILSDTLARSEDGTQSVKYIQRYEVTDTPNEQLLNPNNLVNIQDNLGREQLRWNNRSYINGLSHIEVFQNGILFVTLSEDMSENISTNNYIILEPNTGQNVWKVRAIALDGLVSDFSKEITLNII